MKNNSKRTIFTVLMAILCLSILCFVGCGEKEDDLLSVDAPNEITYEINDTHDKVTIITEGDNLEYSIDGSNWQDSNVFTIAKEKKLTLSARFKADSTHYASAVSSKIITTIPDASKISVAPVDDVDGMIAVDLGSNANIYEFSVDLGRWSQDLSYEVESESVNVRARLKKENTTDFADFISFDVTGIKINPDKDTAMRVAVPHYTAEIEVSTNTDAEGMFIRDGIENNRSFKLTSNAIYNEFVMNIVHPDEFVGCSLDIKIECEGYNQAGIAFIDNQAGEYHMLGIAQIGEWKSLVLPKAYMAFNTPNCDTAVAGTFVLYIDNVTFLTSDEVKEYNENSNLLVQNADLDSATFLKPQEALSGADSRGPGNEVTFIKDGDMFMVSTPAGNGYGWRYGINFTNLKITDLTDYDGISFYTWMPTTTTTNGFAFYTDATVVDNDTYNSNLVRWSINHSVLVGYHQNGGYQWQKQFISKASLISAGYDVTNLTHFTLMFADINEQLETISAESALFKGMGCLYISDLEAANYDEDLLIVNGDYTKASLISQYSTGCAITNVANGINLGTNGWGHKQNLRLSFDAIDLTDMNGIEFYVRVSLVGVDNADLKFYTKAGLEDGTISDFDFANAVEIATYTNVMFAGDPSLYGHVLKVTVSKADLTTAGYDITNFNTFDLSYVDGAGATTGFDSVLLTGFKAI